MNQRSVSLSPALAGLGLVAAAALALSSCMSFDLGGAVSKQMGQSSESQQQAPQNESPQQSPSQASSNAMAYQYQFNAFYSGFWNMGWFGYKEGNYKPGQGTVWQFTGTESGSKQPVTFERALLKANADSSQWWRFKMDTDKESILYEFLVGSDGTVQKVRYKDPDTGSVQEFVPSQSGQAPASRAPSREDIANYKVDSPTITVKAGTFHTDHYRYTDPQAGGSAESWVSNTVPGYMVKTIYTSDKNNRTSSGELIKIESGVTTVIGSF